MHENVVNSDDFFASSMGVSTMHFGKEHGRDAHATEKASDALKQVEGRRARTESRVRNDSRLVPSSPSERAL
jgi:hypothetical protein